MKKHFLKKLIIDPCPIMEYFVPEGDEDIIKAILTEPGIRYSLDVHTVNPEYAASIANRMKVKYTPCHRPIVEAETRTLLERPVSATVGEYLASRKFTPELCAKYGVSSWKYEAHEYHSWAPYFPFNLPALLRASVALKVSGFECFLPAKEFMMVASYDRRGVFNNLVFRFIDEDIATWMAKWLFSHGRQATFGLESIDPTKPVILVEGFFDYVACREMGLNAVGLGSAFISSYHWRFLEGLNVCFLLDSDETGSKYSLRLKDEGQKVLILKDTYKDPWEYYQNGQELSWRIA